MRVHAYASFQGSKIDLCACRAAQLISGHPNPSAPPHQIPDITNQILTFGTGIFGCWCTPGVWLMKAAFWHTLRLFPCRYQGELAGWWNISGSNAAGRQIDQVYWQLWCRSDPGGEGGGVGIGMLSGEGRFLSLLFMWRKNCTGGWMLQHVTAGDITVLSLFMATGIRGCAACSATYLNCHAFTKKSLWTLSAGNWYRQGSESNALGCKAKVEDEVHHRSHDGHKLELHPVAS